jgi:hypothetical protein
VGQGKGEAVTTHHESNGGNLEDPSFAAGVIARVDGQLQTVIAEQQRQGRMLDRIAHQLGIEPEKSDPPPIRGELASLREIDAEITGQVKAVSADLAATKVDVRFGLIRGIPKLQKALIAVALALTALVGLATQIWQAMHGH